MCEEKGRKGRKREEGALREKRNRRCFTLIQMKTQGGQNEHQEMFRFKGAV